jgi:membrane associated rhomboid family serine protease
MWQLVEPRKGLALPGSLILVMVASLVIMTLLDLQMIANEAHLGGFVAGIVYGAITAIAHRVWRTTRREIPRD